LLEWTSPASPQSTIYARIVLQKGQKGQIDVLAAALPGPPGGAGPPSIDQVLAQIGPRNARRLQWADYQDYARSFQADGRVLLSPFVGGAKPKRIYKAPYSIPQGQVMAEVAEYVTRRDGRSVLHTIRTSEFVPYAFLESTYEGTGERLRVYLFGTLDDDDLGPLQGAFPDTAN
jgi:hypothetical protein